VSGATPSCSNAAYLHLIPRTKAATLESIRPNGSWKAKKGAVHSAAARAERAASARAYLALRASSSSTAAGSRPREASST
jgi:hypothetical protein